MKRFVRGIPLVFLIAACGGNSSGGQTGNNSTNSNTIACPGTPPAADLHQGVCAEAVKVCDPSSGRWVEPDYQRIPGYEAVEVTCDGRDNDCDGLQDENLTKPFYQDADGDGYGNGNQDATLACTAPDGHVADDSDCDDSPTTGASCHTGCRNYYRDTDGDGYGDPAQPLAACALPDGYAENADDCAPSDPAHWSDCATCTDQDGDLFGQGCDLGPDCDDSPTTGASCHSGCGNYYRDTDGDGHGDPAQPLAACALPDGYSENGMDCDDNDASRNPGAMELCNGIDDDCDGEIDVGDCQPHASCDDEGGTVPAHCSCDDGYAEPPAAPGTCQPAAQPTAGDLAITEIMIQPEGSASLPEGQYFEMVNTTDATLNLTGILFAVDNSTEQATSLLATPAILPAHGYFVVASSGDATRNGGVSPDLVFSGMPELEAGYGRIRVVGRDGGQVLDQVTWDSAWNHAQGAALELSPGAFAGDPASLNDEGVHWCHHRFSTLPGGDRGTPGAENDDCIVTWCNLQWPPSTSTTVGQATEPIYGQVYEPGITDSLGQGPFLSAELGYGPENSLPGNGWSWTPATYNTDSGNNDEYSAVLVPSSEGTFDYAYRMSMDGGLTWQWCDRSGTSRDGAPYDLSDSGVLTANPVAWVHVALGFYHSCATATNGNTYCWGENSWGQLGNPQHNATSVPTTVSGGYEFTVLTAGSYHTCGLAASGTAYCWGWNDYGQIGDGSTTNRDAPTQVGGGLTFVALSGGYNHTCGIADDGSAHCWGYNGYGQLGDGSTTRRLVPTPVSGGLVFTHLATGWSHSCALADDGKTYCWGRNNSGQLGDGTTTTRTVPTLVNGGLHFISIYAGDYHTCGIADNGKAYCWGKGSTGQLGDNSQLDRHEPTAVSGGTDFQSMEGGGGHSCSVSTGGSAACWGDNGNGQIGDGSLVTRLTPTPVSGGHAFSEIAAGEKHTCAVTSAGDILCWGYNGHGELGNGSTTDAPEPTSVLTPW